MGTYSNRTGHSRYYLSTEKVKGYSVMIDGRNCFDQPLKNDIKMYENIQKIANGQGEDYLTAYLLDCNYFK